MANPKDSDYGQCASCKKPCPAKLFECGERWCGEPACEARHIEMHEGIRNYLDALKNGEPS